MWSSGQATIVFTVDFCREAPPASQISSTRVVVVVMHPHKLTLLLLDTKAHSSVNGGGDTRDLFWKTTPTWKCQYYLAGRILRSIPLLLDVFTSLRCSKEGLGKFISIAKILSVWASSRKYIRIAIIGFRRVRSMFLCCRRSAAASTLFSALSTFDDSNTAHYCSM